jgi:hypothetical protein
MCLTNAACWLGGSEPAHDGPSVFGNPHTVEHV